MHGWYSADRARYGASIYINTKNEEVSVTEITDDVDETKLRHTCIIYVGELCRLVYNGFSARLTHGGGIYMDDLLFSKDLENHIKLQKENCMECRSNKSMTIVKEQENEYEQDEGEMELID